MACVRNLAVGVMLGALVLFSYSMEAIAQSASDLVGTWSLVSITQGQGNTKAEPFGPNPDGLLSVEANGRLSLIIIRSGLPRFASNNRGKGTPEENQEVMRGILCYFATYTVDEASKVLVMHVLASTFPNWGGTDQERKITLNGDGLSWVDAHPSAGGPSAVMVWRRAR